MYVKVEFFLALNKTRNEYKWKGGDRPPRILILQIYSMVSVDKYNQYGETLNVLAFIQTYLKPSVIIFSLFRD